MKASGHQPTTNPQEKKRDNHQTEERRKEGRKEGRRRQEGSVVAVTLVGKGRGKEGEVKVEGKRGRKKIINIY